MDAAQVNQTTELLPLLGKDMRKTGAYHVGACPFCGGRDRFTVKHTPQGDRWHCRQCGDGKYHTPIDYIMRRDDCDFKTAYQTLTGETPRPAREAATPRPQPKPRPLTLPLVEWQAQALQIVYRASDSLLSDEGRAGQDYLSRRGLLRGTWYAWLLGYAVVFDPKVKRNRPAIVLPWLDMDAGGQVITALKYRFIDNDPAGLRYISLAGSMPLLFGLWDVTESDSTLLLVEGEINALSLWQCRPRGASVLSFGSEGGGRADVLQIIAKRYRRVIVWCDDAKRSRQYQAMLARPCEKIQSLKIDGEKLDANRLLQKGELHSFFSQVLRVECLGRQAGQS